MCLWVGFLTGLVFIIDTNSFISLENVIGLSTLSLQEIKLTRLTKIIIFFISLLKTILKNRLLGVYAQLVGNNQKA